MIRLLYGFENSASEKIGNRYYGIIFVKIGK